MRQYQQKVTRVDSSRLSESRRCLFCRTAKAFFSSLLARALCSCFFITKSISSFCFANCLSSVLARKSSALESLCASRILSRSDLLLAIRFVTTVSWSRESAFRAFLCVADSTRRSLLCSLLSASFSCCNLVNVACVDVREHVPPM